MSPALIATDEEADTGPYLWYLRSLSDADLLDIARHTDPEAYPARCDMQAREVRRRGVVARSVYSPVEYAVRWLSVGVMALCALPLTLACLLDEQTARGPVWPDASALSDGASGGRVLTLLLVSVLRSALVLCVRLGVFTLVGGILTGWLLRHVSRLRVACPARDVARLALAALCVLLLTFAVSECSAVSALFPAAPRGLSLLDPFGT